MTLNPCLDKTLTVPEWRPGENVRGTLLREVVGGKGNNVARALVRLGRQARPATFLGGPVGDRCEASFRDDDGFDPLIVRTEAPTREILTLRAAKTPATAFFDPDPAITPSEAEVLLNKVEGTLAVGGVEALTLSGSSPSPATHGLYVEMIALARSRKVPVFLDTYGPPLEALWGIWPDAIQLNRREGGLLLRNPNPSPADLDAMLRRWSARGVKVAVVTDGPNPVLARVGSRAYSASPPPIEPVNPIGSGDCMLAGLVDGFLGGLEPVAMLRRAVACAVANALVWDAGAIGLDEVRGLEPRVKVEQLS